MYADRCLNNMEISKPNSSVFEWLNDYAHSINLTPIFWGKSTNQQIFIKHLLFAPCKSH